ncbi:MAG: hypothetical protein A2748_01580 [Candidatus Wildermuthbacteria bacterium RIFCSPHIGHO2_01_FULL_45_20]|uniref:Uncharacterized protein n=1 Tax=Candidatus Wildermuthbacteria bacterium RIFCSPHIGHO2_02_FULL_45_25 TaxID=1802450 RepID=A0A1G2R5V8_9BACT|nr:MAG: hypothetical protein A2748_01580 [Candidatus Wildermuthbacteria bacterium RIFCSPHIGHO2_01_FULL_45_20]OHA67471.1 MAG: hypothetical protein A3C04_00790 [Candidatus Wildermuthbacteria bacterium RIFCSPHIGHO2_02_FULL_45_25]
MVKIDVDIEREILTIGGEWHSEGDELLSEEDGYKSTNVWGCNFYPWNPPEKRIVFTSLINLKPSIGHRNMEVQDDQIKERMKGIIRSLLLDDNETLDV